MSNDMGEPMDDIAAMIVDTPQKEAEQTDIELDAKLASVDDTEAEAVKGKPPEDPEAVEMELDEADDAEDEADPDEPVEAEAEDVTDDDDDSEELEAEQEETLHTVKVDGKPQLVTYDELLRGYSGQAYIQQNFEELKTQKQQLAEAAEFLQNERDRILSLSQQVETGQNMQPPTPPSRELLHSDPIGYMEAKAQYDDDLAAYEKAQGDVQALQQQSEAQKQQAHQRMVQEQMQKLTEAIPELADPERGPALRDKLVATGALYDFSDAEMRSQTDARYIRVLNDAMKYRELMAGRKQADKKAEKRPSNVVRPGVKKSATTTKARAAKQAASRMRKFGSVDDVANFLIS